MDESEANFYINSYDVDYAIQFLYLCVGNRHYPSQKPVDVGNTGV